ERYKIRFTPRKPSSIWSNININRAQELIQEGRMQPAGLKAFEARKKNRSGIYSYENRPEQLDEPYLSMMTANREASEFFNSRTASYRRAAIWWVISAKQEETRLKRLKSLIELSEQKKTIPQFTPMKRST